MRTATIILVVVALAGCSTMRHATDQSKEPQISLRDLCKAGKYHDAMRALPNEMQYWTEYEKRTGETTEGAGGYEYATTMSTIAERGDGDWGKILDDPDIPYEYKAEMVFEILEARLGKGAVYVGNKENFIVPRHRQADLDKEMIKLPEK